MNPCLCLTCQKDEPVWGSWLCEACLQALKRALEHPETTRPPFEQGKPVSKRVVPPRPTRGQQPKLPRKP